MASLKRSFTCPRFDIMLEAKNKDLALLELRQAIRAAGKEQLVW